MDTPTPPAGRPDRRHLVRLVLAGATGTALTQAGIPMTATAAPWEGPQIAVDSIRRTLHATAAGYDQWGPGKASAALRAAELSMQGVFTGHPKMSSGEKREAKAVYAQLLTMAATADTQLGKDPEAIQAGDLAASLAYEIGDTQTAAHAWGVVSGALRNSGKPRYAVATAQRARRHAGTTPAAPMALLEEAFAELALGHRDAALAALTDAEQAHAVLHPDTWGTPGYPFGTFHPAVTKAYAGWALAKVGLYAEAAPRLDEAAHLLAGTRGLKRAFVWMTQAHALLGTGDVDAAHDMAALAVASTEDRPAVWVATHVAELDRQARGAFADLAGQTSRWGFATA